MNKEKKENDLINDSNDSNDTQHSGNINAELKNQEDSNNIETKDDEAKEESADENKEENKLEILENELKDTKDKLLRVLAENENIRKQSEKNRIDIIKYGVQPLARELVNVVDNFERAINSIKNADEKKTLEGFELIQKDIIQILEKFNVKKIDALGKPFDANLHQAMFEKPTKDYELGLVCEIVQDGYTFHDRLLRPAMVGISKEEEKQENDNEIEEEKTIENPQQNEFD
tara:strand:- start:247 stop:939 length:693 start_codon:yes stop_codon:yes gene_type:complete